MAFNHVRQHPVTARQETICGHQFVVVVQSWSYIWLFVTSWTAVCQVPLSFTISWSLLKFMSIESVMVFNHLILCRPPSPIAYNLPASGSFPVRQLFASGDQSIGASASALVFPMHIQCWFPLGLTGLISLQSKGHSRVFSCTAIRKHPFFGAQPSLWSSSHIRT